MLVEEHDIDIDAGLLETAGFGEDRPVEPNETEDGEDNPEGRAKNRRVEVVLDDRS